MLPGLFDPHLLFLELFQVLLRLMDRPSQGQEDRFGQVLLQVKQIRLVRHLEFGSGATNQARSLIAREQHDVNGKAVDTRADGLCPGNAVALIAVGFDQDEVGDGFDGDQANVWAVEVLVGAQDDVFVGHAWDQPLAFFLCEEVEVVLQPEIHVIESAVGGANKGVELDEFEERTNRAEATGVFVMEDKEQSEDESAQEGIADGAAEKPDQVGIEMVGKVLAEPIAEGGARNAMLLGIVTLRNGRIRGVGEVGMGGGGVDPIPEEGVLPGVDVRGRLAESHGSRPLRCLLVESP